jgi:hypothetical protein
MRVNNLVGERGENAVHMCFIKLISGHNGFEPHFLGAKAQLIDFHVALLDENGKAFGPHFFVQVKARHGKSVGSFNTGFTSHYVKSAKEGWVPFYVVGVDLVSNKREDVWLCGLETQTTLNTIPRSHNLKSQTTLKRLYTEVLKHFDSNSYAFTTTLR